MSMNKLMTITAATCVAAIASTMQAATTKYSAESGELVYGTYNEANPGSSTMVTTTATLAFPDITLDDITNYVFTGYVKSGAVSHPASTIDARKAIHCDADGHADKIVTQFAIWDNTGVSAHTKAVIVEFTNGTGGVFVKKYASRYRNSNSDRFTQFFAMDANGDISLKQSSGNYDLYSGLFANVDGTALDERRPGASPHAERPCRSNVRRPYCGLCDDAIHRRNLWLQPKHHEERAGGRDVDRRRVPGV